jgi:hypothetical protein
VRVDFVGRHSELRILGERLAAAEMGHPQVVYVEGEAGAGKSTLLSQFLGSLLNAVILQVAGDEAETLLPYGIIDQLQPGISTEPGTDPMAVGARLLDLLDRRQTDGHVVVLAIDDLQWADRPSSRAVLFALRRLRADKVLAVVGSRGDGMVDPRPGSTGWPILAGPGSWAVIRGLPASAWAGSARTISSTWPRPWGWACCHGARRRGWLPTPKATRSTAGRCSTSSALSG